MFLHCTQLMCLLRKIGLFFLECVTFSKVLASPHTTGSLLLFYSQRVV